MTAPSGVAGSGRTTRGRAPWTRPSGARGSPARARARGPTRPRRRRASRPRSPKRAAASPHCPSATSPGHRPGRAERRPRQDVGHLLEQVRGDARARGDPAEDRTDDDDRQHGDGSHHLPEASARDQGGRGRRSSPAHRSRTSPPRAREQTSPTTRAAGVRHHTPAIESAAPTVTTPGTPITPDERQAGQQGPPRDGERDEPRRVDASSPGRRRRAAPPTSRGRARTRGAP